MRTPPSGPKGKPSSQKPRVNGWSLRGLQCLILLEIIVRMMHEAPNYSSGILREKIPLGLISPWEISGGNAGNRNVTSVVAIIKETCQPACIHCCWESLRYHMGPTCLTIQSSWGSLFLMCCNIGYAPFGVFTLQECCPAEEGSAVAASSVFCSSAFAMISEKRYWGVLPWQHRMELCWIVALCQGLSLHVSRVCLLRVNCAYQLSVSL